MEPDLDYLAAVIEVLVANGVTEFNCPAFSVCFLAEREVEAEVDPSEEDTGEIELEVDSLERAVRDADKRRKQ